MSLSNAEVEDRLWKAIEDNHTGMLGVPGNGHHYQPMTGFVERETNTLWFFTRRETDLARTVGEHGGADGVFIFQDRKLQACLDGRLTLEHDRERIDRYWNAHVAAWYPDGKDDPALTLLRLDVADAAVWITEGGLLKYALEVVKANVGKSTPDVGERRDLNLH